MLPTITCIGNLKYIETRTTQSGKNVTSFTINCAEKNAKGEWNNLNIKGECWDKASDFLSGYFKDGDVAIVTGKLITNVYEKQDGTKVYENKLLFPNVSFTPKAKNDAPPPQQDQHNQQKSNGYQPQQQDLDLDESIPF